MLSAMCLRIYQTHFFKDSEERSIPSYCTHEEKINFKSFPENGCYGNRPQPLEVLFDSTDSNNPCSFIKNDLIFKQAYLVGFRFVRSIQ